MISTQCVFETLAITVEFLLLRYCKERERERFTFFFIFIFDDYVVVFVVVCGVTIVNPRVRCDEVICVCRCLGLGRF